MAPVNSNNEAGLKNTKTNSLTAVTIDLFVAHFYFLFLTVIFRIISTKTIWVKVSNLKITNDIDTGLFMILLTYYILK